MVMASNRVINNIVTGLLISVPTLALSCESSIVKQPIAIANTRVLGQSFTATPTRCLVQREVSVHSTRVTKIEFNELDDSDLSDVSFNHLYSNGKAITIEVKSIEKGRFHLNL
jgi:hypothetical protein